MVVKGKVRTFFSISSEWSEKPGSVQDSRLCICRLPAFVVSEALVVIVIGNSNDSIPCFDYDNDYDNELLRRR